MQFRIDYLPYDMHHTLTLIRGSYRLHTWNIGVPPIDECIHAILHLHMFCVYIGHTHLALCKHITIAIACSEDCNFHQLLRHTTGTSCLYNMSGVRCNLQLLNGNGGTNTVGGLSTTSPQQYRLMTRKAGKKVPHRAVHVLRNLSQAKANRDYTRVAALQREAAAVAQEIYIPPFHYLCLLMSGYQT